MQTDRYIRKSGLWIKVTRDPRARTFAFALGWENEVKAFDLSKFSFRYVPTWAEAMETAERKIADYAPADTVAT